MICSFGIHNIHQRTNITEGGVIGMMLLIDHWLHLSPAYITPVLDAKRADHGTQDNIKDLPGRYTCLLYTSRCV